MTDRTYNGWTNYATWRVNLEMFDGWDPTDVFDTDVTRDQLEDYLRETAEQYVEDTSTPTPRTRPRSLRAIANLQ